MINNLGTQSYKLQINFGMLQIDAENSATGIAYFRYQQNCNHNTSKKISKKVFSIVKKKHMKIKNKKKIAGLSPG